MSALAKVERWSWRQIGEPENPSAGPVHLLFADGSGILIDGRSDWSLEMTETTREDDAWRARFDYDVEGSRWSVRDASRESPFLPVLGRRLTSLEPIHNEVGEVTGLRLDFDGRLITLNTWQGEVTTGPVRR
ncbi:hypothetical protein [Actinoplanes sp. NBRC 101535]|uniref:hypothetical protein n=1 Tax=Actinoplanes sp. NBRC 101535 TaxID=3032196 RepID=UPI0025574D31|nr:hypothetical protein [Actinoplanes sp. NBRC 101535]